jgi:hypothetical protein
VEASSGNARPRHRQRILLVGLTRLMLDVLEGPLSDLADVSAVPFPSDAFERLVDEMRPALVVVDVTWLREERVRPAMLERLAGLRPVIVFTADTGGGWVDDLGSGRSWSLADNSHETIARLLPARPLTVVGGRAAAGPQPRP